MTSRADTTLCEPPLAGRARPGRRGRSEMRAWLGLALLSLPTVLLGLDLTLLHLALPALAADLRPSATQALWIMDAYGFMIAGFLIPAGTLGDRLGRRRLLMIGAAAFAAASVLAAFSTSAAMLIAARAALGVAGATLMPSTLALISTLFPDPSRRAVAVGIWATMFALGMAMGPVAGGILLTQFWWGAAFLPAVPILALVLLLGPVLLPEYRAPGSRRLDLPSMALAIAAMLALVQGIKQTAKDGIDPAVLAAIGTGLALAFLFVRRQRRLADPLLDLGLFNHRAFTFALVVLLLGLVPVGGTMLLVTQHLQLVLDLTPLAAGIWMGPPALAMAVAGIGAPLAARHAGPAVVVAGALGLSALGYLMLALLGAEEAHATSLVVVVTGFALAYAGLGTLAALGTDLVIGSAPPHKAGSAAALSEAVQELGLSLGIALLGSLASAIYRQAMLDHRPANLPQGARDALGDSL